MDWLAAFQPLLVTTFLFLLFVGLAMFLFLSLRSFILNLRPWLAGAKALSPEEEAVTDIARYQGSFQFHRPGVVRQEFARRYELRFHNHWACAGKWLPDD